MFFKYLLQYEGTDSSMQFSTNLKELLRKEMRFLGLYVFLGILLSSIIVWFSILLADEYRLYLHQFQNGVVIEVLTFAAVIIVGLLTFYFVFKGDKFRRSKNVSLSSASMALTMEDEMKNIAIEFANGVYEGFIQNKRRSHFKKDLI